MGSGDWFKTIILKKVKVSGSKQAKKSSSAAKSNAFKLNNNLQKYSSSISNGAKAGNSESLVVQVEDVAATRIQNAFRAYMARKKLRRLKGTARLLTLTQGHSTKRQATSTLGHLHSWSKIQAQIRERRLCMVMEGRIKQRRLENQQKLEAKLHDLEVDWCGGSEIMEEILGRIQEREEAAVKRERAMAYAFTHQWRANTSQTYGLGKDEVGKANWGWSWMDRWIAARPWESRVLSQTSPPQKVPGRQASKIGKNLNSPSPKTPVSSKPLSNGKGSLKARRLSYPPSAKPAAQEGAKNGDAANDIQGKPAT